MSKIDDIFSKQKELQSRLGLAVGSENIVQWYNSLTAAVLEIGEALSEDTRWKLLVNANTKQPKINRENVIEETADVFIYLINSCIFYNISVNELLNKIVDKQNRNIVRLLRIENC